MKHYYTLILAMLFSIPTFGQVSIGSGTYADATSGPICAWYEFSYYQTIYRASDIGASGNITSIQYEMQNEDPITNADNLIDVWVGHTSKNVFENTSDWIPTSAMTKVVTNGTAVKSGTTVTITFNTPFNYNGTDNLVIAIDANEPGDGSQSDKFYYTAMENGDRVSIYCRADGFNPDPENTEAITDKFTSTQYPNIIINGITQNCPKPTNLTATNITGNSADLGWTENGTANSWTIEYGPIGFTEGNGTVVNVDTNPYTLTGLTASTQYDFYVKANCSTENSFSNGPLTFATACDAIAVDYEADLSIYPPICWNIANGEYGETLTFGESRWREGRGFTNNGNEIKSNAVNIYSGTFSEPIRTWLISNNYDLDAGELTLETTVAVTDYSYSGISSENDIATMGSDDSVMLLISTDDGTTWTELAMWDVNNQPDTTGTPETFDLSGYSGTAKFAFYASSGDVKDDEDYDFHVGKFKMTVNNLAVNEVKNNKSNFEFYPNPVNNFLFIKGEQKVGNVKIYDVTGKLVYQNSFDKNVAEINVSSLTSGQYIVNAEIDGAMQNFKIIKK